MTLETERQERLRVPWTNFWEEPRVASDVFSHRINGTGICLPTFTIKNQLNI